MLMGILGGIHETDWKWARWPSHSVGGVWLSLKKKVMLKGGRPTEMLSAITSKSRKETAARSRKQRRGEEGVRIGWILNYGHRREGLGREGIRRIAQAAARRSRHEGHESMQGVRQRCHGGDV